MADRSRTRHADGPLHTLFRGSYMPLEGRRTLFHPLRMHLQLPAELGEPVAGWMAFDELACELLLERGQMAVDRRLIYAQGPCCSERTAFASHGQEVSQVIPVEHALVMQFCTRTAQACCSQPDGRIAI